jgi:hypothetical protein
MMKIRKIGIEMGRNIGHKWLKVRIYGKFVRGRNKP